MNKLFARTLIASAVASAALTATPTMANETDAKYEVYGIIAVQAHYRDYKDQSEHRYDKTATPDNLTGFQTNNESRIGFRGSKQFKNMDSKFIWQVESGYVDPSYAGHEAKGGLGERDTFVGFEDFDSFGQVRIGRVLTPLYEVVDWPGANPGLGDVWDWGGMIGGNKFQDRSSNTVRWDSPTWGGLSLDVAYGRTKAAATGSDQGWWQGGAAHYKVGPIQFDAAYEVNRDVSESVGKADTTDNTDISRIWDNNTYLLGMQGWFENGISFFAQYRMQDAEVKQGTETGREEKQNALSSGLMYNINDWQFKVGYTKNFDLEVNGKTIEDSADDTISAQAMYFVDPSAVLYLRARDVRMGDNNTVSTGNGGDYARWKSHSFSEVSVGVEYYF